MAASAPAKPVCAAYMGSLISVISDLKLDHIIANADEDILSKLLQIKWNKPEKYEKVEPFAGGINFVRVIHALLYKRKDWFIQFGAIADGSADKTVEGIGNSYYRLHKTGVCAISQLLVEKLTDDYSTMEESSIRP